MNHLRLNLLIALTASALSAHAGTIFGLAQTGGIYEIDTLTGSSFLITPTVVSPIRGNVNGLVENKGDFYYADAKKLLKNDTTTESFFTNVDNQANANAAGYQDKYYYVSGANKLKSVDLLTKASATYTVTGAATGFGDIAINRKGKVWSSVVSGIMQTFDLNNLAAGATTLSDKTAKFGLQLGFDALDNLYGINYDDGKIYSINLATGSRLWTGGIVKDQRGNLLKISDAASNNGQQTQTVPEPFTMALGAAGIGLATRRRRQTSK